MNAPGSLYVSVTREDIMQGRRSDTRHCPIALALKRRYGDAPFVSADWISINFDDGYARYSHSPASHRFVDLFDEGEITPGPARFIMRRQVLINEEEL